MLGGGYYRGAQQDQLASCTAKTLSARSRRQPADGAYSWSFDLDGSEVIRNLASGNPAERHVKSGCCAWSPRAPSAAAGDLSSASRRWRRSRGSTASRRTLSQLQRATAHSKANGCSTGQRDGTTNNGWTRCPRGIDPATAPPCRSRRSRTLGFISTHLMRRGAQPRHIQNVKSRGTSPNGANRSSAARA